MRLCKVVAAAVLAAFVTVGAGLPKGSAVASETASTADGIAGLWRGQLPFGSRAETEIRLDRSETGWAGTWTGFRKTTLPDGSQKLFQLLDVQVDGDKVTFKLPLDRPGPVPVEMTVKGDQLVGTMTIPVERTLPAEPPALEFILNRAE